MATRYYWSLLNESEKKTYKKIVEQINIGVLTVKIGNVFDRSSLFKIIEYIAIDYPEYFYIDFSNVIIENNFTVAKVIFKSLLSKEGVDRKKLMINQKIQEISSYALNNAKTNLQKEKVVHDYFIRKIKYADSSLFNEKYVYTIEGPLLYGVGVCEGISKAFKIVLDNIKIPAFVVSGEAINNLINQKEGHSWNVAKIDGDCTQIDVTWDICLSNSTYKSCSYFNVSDNDMYVDHFPKHKIPKCVRVSDLSTHILNEIEIKNQLQKFFRSNQNNIELRVSKNMDEIQCKKIISSVLSTINSTKRISYTFNSNIGVLTVFNYELRI